jgi:raffinose/stachyose/melibiose transport system substrate-binding protein
MLAAGGLTACGGSDEGDSGSTPKAGGNKALTGTLTFWQTPTEETVGPWWKKFIAGFEAAHPGVKVEYTQMTTDNQLTKPQAAFTVGEEPDILEMTAGELLDQYVRAGRIAKLNDLVDLKPLNPASLDLVTGPDGEIYEVPTSWSVLFMWSNEKLLAKHGVEVPKTWDDMLAACKTLSAKGVVPIALGNRGQDLWTTTHWFDSLLYQFGGAGIAYDATFDQKGVTWADPPFIQAGTQLKSLVDADCFPKGFTGLNYSQMSSLFVRGEAAMIFTGTWFGAGLNSGGAKFPVAISPLPDAPGAVNSTENLDGMIGGASGFAATTKGVKEHGELVAAFLNEVAKAVDQYALENNALSVAANPEPPTDPLQARMTELLDGVGELAQWPHLTVPSSIRTAEFQNVQALTSGSITPEELGAKMTETVDRERPKFPKLPAPKG